MNQDTIECSDVGLSNSSEIMGIGGEMGKKSNQSKGVEKMQYRNKSSKRYLTRAEQTIGPMRGTWE